MSHFITKFWLGCGFAALACLLLTGASASGQTPPPGGDEMIMSGFLTCPVGNGEVRECPFNVHYVKLEEGRTYAIRMESTEFQSRLTVEDMLGNELAADTDYFADLYGMIVFRPPTTGEYRLVATSVPARHEGFYMITLREMPVVTAVDAVLSPGDAARDGCFERRFEVAMVEGQRYVIDMASRDFDPYMTILNAEGAIVAFNDECTATLPTRIVFTPTRTGTYTVVTTSTNPFATGAYRLTVCVD